MDMSQTPATLGIAALAAHFAYLFNVVSDKDREQDELDAVVTTITCREPRDHHELLSLAIALKSELDTLAANSRVAIDLADDDDPPDADQLAEADSFRRLHKASQALVRGLIRHTGADSPMVPLCVKVVD